MKAKANVDAERNHKNAGIHIGKNRYAYVISPSLPGEENIKDICADSDDTSFLKKRFIKQTD
jgi:hypothetical protein